MLKTYVATLLPYLAVDLLWIGVVAKAFYRRELGPLMRTPPWLAPAALFYLLYPLGLGIFAVAPGIAARSAAHAGGLGLLFGFFAYATYDLVNVATIKGWSVKLTLVDLAWGTLMSGAVAWVAARLLI
jgi:uncharacterized membrane protein